MPWFNPSWMTWWGSSTSSQMSWDDIDLSRMNPAASLPSIFSLPSHPFLFTLLLTQGHKVVGRYKWCVLTGGHLGLPLSMPHVQA